MINSGDRNPITAVKTYPRANIKSNHNPLLEMMNLKLRKQCE